MKNIIKKTPLLGNWLRKLKYNIVKLRKYYRIKKYVKQNDKLKVVIGSSNVYEEGWCPTDIDNLNLLKIETFDKLFKDRKVDVFLAEHVLEHLSPEEARIALQNCYFI